MGRDPNVPTAKKARTSNEFEDLVLSSIKEHNVFSETRDDIRIEIIPIHEECEDASLGDNPGLSCSLDYYKDPCNSSSPKVSTFPAYIYQLSNLQSLTLQYLENLPIDLDRFPNLTHIHLGDLTDKALPTLTRCIESVYHLEHLEIDSLSQWMTSGDVGDDEEDTEEGQSEALSIVPPEIGGLQRLLHLDFQHLGVSELPISIGQLSCLRSLTVSHCVVLEHLPDVFTGLTSLEELKLEGLSRISSLPPSFGRMSILQKLHVCTCRLLTNLPDLVELPNLQEMNIDSCCSLLNLPDLGQLRNLRKLKIQRCSQLTNIPDLRQMQKLQMLDIQRCSLLTNLAEINLGLTNLTLGYLPIAKLPDLVGCLSYLEHLHLVGLSELSSVPLEIGYLSNLRTLQLCSLDSLVSLPISIGYLQRLETLTLDNCGRISRIPEALGDLASCLRTLELKSLHNLIALPRSIGSLRCLQTMDICALPNLTHLPNDLGDMKSLSCLALTMLENLVSLPRTIRRLQNLQTLSIYHCPKLSRTPPDFGNLTHTLEEFEVVCTGLTSHSSSIRILQDEVGKMERLKSFTLVLPRNRNHPEEAWDILSNLPPCLKSLDLDTDDNDEEESNPKFAHLTNLPARLKSCCLPRILRRQALQDDDGMKQAADLLARNPYIRDMSLFFPGAYDAIADEQKRGKRLHDILIWNRFRPILNGHKDVIVRHMPLLLAHINHNENFVQYPSFQASAAFEVLRTHDWYLSE